MFRYRHLLPLIATALLAAPPTAEAAPSLCLKNSTGALTVRPRKCRKGETPLKNLSQLTGPQGEQGQTGPQGPAGTDGADGQLRIYGNGSAGAANINAAGTSTLYYDVGSAGHAQFTDFTIAAGSTLDVPSGTVIRCTGTFTNNGTINVVNVQDNAGVGWFMSNTEGTFTLPAPGPAGRSASVGEAGDESQIRSGGWGGAGITDAEALNLFRPSLYGGGSGAGTISMPGGIGGGSLTILAKGAIVNGTGAQILAQREDGGEGAGGGAGGIIILASPTSITNSGVIRAEGGDGGASNTDSAPGGGGGGGLVRMISPIVTKGTVSVSAGSGGTVSGAAITTARHSGGGGGGGCAGPGGNGGQTSAANPPIASAGSPGTSGYSIVTLTDPTALF